MGSEVKAVTITRLEIRKRASLAFPFIGLLASLLAWFYLTQTSETTTAIIRLHELGSERESLRRENAALRYQVAVLESISPVQAEAKKRGFTPPLEMEYLPIPRYQDPLTLPSPAGESTVAQDNSSPNFWWRLWNQFWLLLRANASQESL